jgi:hypothetical protein
MTETVEISACALKELVANTVRLVVTCPSSEVAYAIIYRLETISLTFKSAFPSEMDLPAICKDERPL